MSVFVCVWARVWHCLTSSKMGTKQSKAVDTEISCRHRRRRFILPLQQINYSALTSLCFHKNNTCLFWSSKLWITYAVSFSRGKQMCGSLYKAHYKPYPTFKSCLISRCQIQFANDRHENVIRVADFNHLNNTLLHLNRDRNIHHTAIYF